MKAGHLKCTHIDAARSPRHVGSRGKIPVKLYRFPLGGGNLVWRYSWNPPTVGAHTMYVPNVGLGVDDTWHYANLSVCLSVCPHGLEAGTQCGDIVGQAFDSEGLPGCNGSGVATHPW